MHTIYKYHFSVEDTIEILMPEGAKILSIQVKDNKPTAWVLCDPLNELVRKRLRVLGTGHKVTNVFGTLSYIATIQIDGLVWHVFA